MMAKEVSQLPAPKAWELLQHRPGATLVDVRSSVEFHYVGHPMDSLSVPLMEPPDWQPVQDFTTRVRAALAARHGPDQPLESLPLLLICRSGRRSQVAGEALLDNGFQEIYNISDGFEGALDGRKHRSAINGWRHYNLPWEQS